MPGRRRTILQRNRDRSKIAELLIQGLSTKDIAKRVGLLVCRNPKSAARLK